MKHSCAKIKVLEWNRKSQKVHTSAMLYTIPHFIPSMVRRQHNQNSAPSNASNVKHIALNLMMARPHQFPPK